MRIVDPAEWKRKPLCDFFGQLDFPFYGVTCRVDVTHAVAHAKQARLSFYHTVTWASMRAVNAVEAYLYKVRGETIVRHECLSPSFVASAEDDLFKMVHLEWRTGEPLADFCARAQAKADAQTSLLPDPDDEARDDFVYISCLPWLDFSMITQEMAFNRDDSIPRFTWGKYSEEAGALTMPYAVQVNHRLVDGRHIAAFYEALQRELDAL